MLKSYNYSGGNINITQIDHDENMIFVLSILRNAVSAICNWENYKNAYNIVKLKIWKRIAWFP